MLSLSLKDYLIQIQLLSSYTETVTVTGAEEATYEVAVPAQGTNTFSSFLMYFETQDVEIYMTDFYVTADAKDDTGGGGGDTFRWRNHGYD